MEVPPPSGIYLKDQSSLPYLFSMMLKSTSFRLTAPSRTSNLGKIFLHSHLSFTAAFSLKSEKGWSDDFAKLEAVSLTTMCPKEQQTRNNLIVKDYCFIIEIFDIFSFSGILRGCSSH